MSENQVYLPPEPEPVQSRQDDFDFPEMPPGHGDLNFRAPIILPTNQNLWTIGDLLIAGMAAFPCSFLFRDLLGPYLVGQRVFLFVLLAAFLAGIVQTIRAPGQSSIEARMLTWFFVPTLTWAAIAGAGMAQTWEWTVLYVLLLPVPLTVFIADQLATHSVWWMSANPKLDLATMLAWRADWLRRFSFQPKDRPARASNLTSEARKLHDLVLQIKKSYRFGCIYLVLCVAGGMTMTLLLSSAKSHHERGFVFFVGFTLVLLVSCFCRTWYLHRAFGLFWDFFVAWIYAQEGPVVPAWGFHSPTIPSFARLRLVLSCLFVWAIALAMITDHFAWLLFVDPDPALQPKLSPNFLTKGSPFVFLSVSPENAYSFAYVAIAILACIVFPAVIFTLSLFLLTGPTLTAHFLALEANDAYEQR